MKKTVIAALVMAISPGLSFAEIHEDFRPKAQKSSMREGSRGVNTPREHVLDKYRQERLEHKGGFYRVCKENKFSNAYLQMDCYNAAGEKFREKYPDRGTNAYGKKMYSVLTLEEARQKRDELLKLLDIVSFYPKTGNKEIELTVKHIRQEIHYIERYVLKISPRHYETS